MTTVPRTTERDRSTSIALGGALTPSQVRRLTDDGLGPPLTADPLEYWTRVAPLVGQGRHPYDVVAVELGAMGYVTTRLRRVIAAPDETRAEVIMATFAQAVTEGARSVVKAGTALQAAGLPEAPTVEAAIMVETMAADYVDALTPRAEPPGFHDAASISEAIAVDLGGPAEPGREVYADEFGAYMADIAACLTDPGPWATTAPDDEIALAVNVVRQVWDATVASRIKLGEEDTWRMVAALAPAAGVLVELIADVQSQITADIPAGNEVGPGVG